VEVLGEFARMRLADRSLSVEHVGNNAARSEYGNQIALPNAAILHENAEGLDGLGMAERVFRLLELAYQQRHEVGEVLFLGSERTAAGIQPFEFCDHTLVLRHGFDDTRQRPREELAVGGFVDCR
jgi:hypothetical protein